MWNKASVAFDLHSQKCAPTEIRFNRLVILFSAGFLRRCCAMAQIVATESCDFLTHT